MVYLGADHGGFSLKEKIKEWLTEWGVVFKDVGAYQIDPDDDYPAYAVAVSRSVVDDPDGQGILVCRSSGGMIIAANKIRGIRAVAVFDEKSAKHAREHNNANVIGLSGDWISDDDAKKIVEVFLSTSFSSEIRHHRRVEQIDAIA
jgi:ribose 5-phosphate isomerase B